MQPPENNEGFKCRDRALPENTPMNFLAMGSDVEGIYPLISRTLLLVRGLFCICKARLHLSKGCLHEGL